jgi:D-sedoheptulose 7-phosphate isomerase
MDETRLRALAADSAAVQERFFAGSARLVLEAGRRMCECLQAGGKVLVFGNGGSAADAQHLAAELVGRYLYDRPGLPALALTTDTSALTAIGNDMGYESVFRRQIEAHGRKGDVAIGITTSGRSRNVVDALRVARERGLVTMALTGGGGGLLKDAVDYLLDAPSTDTPRIQELHGLVVHLLCQIVEETLFPRQA